METQVLSPIFCPGTSKELTQGASYRTAYFCRVEEYYELIFFEFLFHFQPAMDLYPFCEPSFPQTPKFKTSEKRENSTLWPSCLSFLHIYPVIKFVQIPGGIVFLTVWPFLWLLMCACIEADRPALSWKGVWLEPLTSHACVVRLLFTLILCLHIGACGRKVLFFFFLQKTVCLPYPP